MRKFAATLAALFTIGAALTAPTPAHADDPACTGAFQITSMTWSPPQVTAGQRSTLTIVIENCTDAPQQGWYSINREFLGSGPGVPPGCPIVEPSPPSFFGLAARGTFTLTPAYDTYADCTATRLLATAKITYGNDLLAEGSANLGITPSAGPWMGLVNLGTNLCLTIYSAQNSANAPIVDWPCLGGRSEQYWQWVGANLRSVLNPSMCLDLFQPQPRPQTSVTIATCDRNSPTQQWRFNGGQLQLQNFPGLCLGVTSPMPIQGGLIALDSCKGVQGQNWTPRY